MTDTPTAPDGGTARRVAVLLGPDFEDVEFDVPHTRLVEHGHRVEVIGTESGAELAGKRGDVTFTTDLAVADADPADYDLVLIPGGYSPDKLRTDDGMVDFVKAAHAAGTPIGAICHAGSLLIEADVVDGVELTSWPSIRTDLVNAGARWVDREVVSDQGIISSRNPDDIPAFVDALLATLGQSVDG